MFEETSSSSSNDEHRNAWQQEILARFEQDRVEERAYRQKLLDDFTEPEDMTMSKINHFLGRAHAGLDILVLGFLTEKFTTMNNSTITYLIKEDVVRYNHPEEVVKGSDNDYWEYDDNNEGIIRLRSECAVEVVGHSRSRDDTEAMYTMYTENFLLKFTVPEGVRSTFSSLGTPYNFTLERYEVMCWVDILNGHSMLLEAVKLYISTGEGAIHCDVHKDRSRCGKLYWPELHSVNNGEGIPYYAGLYLTPGPGYIQHGEPALDMLCNKLRIISSYQVGC